jgi:hypothetical protein
LNQNNNDLIAQINEQKDKIQGLESNKNNSNIIETCFKSLLLPNTIMPYVAAIGIGVFTLSYVAYRSVGSGNEGLNLAQKQHTPLKPSQASSTSSISTADDAIKHTVTIDGAIGLLKTLLPPIQQWAMANKDAYSTHIKNAITTLEVLSGDGGQNSPGLAGSEQKFDDGGAI